MRYVVILLAQLFVATTAAEDTLGTWMSTESYLELPEDTRAFYVVGGLEMLQVALIGVEQKSGFVGKKYFGCFERTSIKQMGAIFDKYLQEHPEYWAESLSVNLVRSVNRFCGYDQEE